MTKFVNIESNTTTYEDMFRRNTSLTNSESNADTDKQTDDDDKKQNGMSSFFS